MDETHVLKEKRGGIIQGACSNQIVKCIVYTSDVEVGKAKLLEIEKEKNDLGITTISKRFSKLSNYNEIRFSDGEEWIIVNPNSGTRGYRYRKAYIDASNTTIAQLHNCILPYGDLYKWEEEKYFNWN